jgi:hypothetical protein
MVIYRRDDYGVMNSFCRRIIILAITKSEHSRSQMRAVSLNTIKLGKRGLAESRERIAKSRAYPTVCATKSFLNGNTRLMVLRSRARSEPLQLALRTEYENAVALPQ